MMLLSWFLAEALILQFLKIFCDSSSFKAFGLRACFSLLVKVLTIDGRLQFEPDEFVAIVRAPKC